MVDTAGELHDNLEHWSQSRIIGALNSIRGDEVHAFHQLGVVLNGQERMRLIGSLHSKTKAKKIGPKQLSQNWGSVWKPHNAHMTPLCRRQSVC